MPELPPEPIIEPPPKSADKLDIMSRNCSELKATLAVLQGQMNALTAEKVTQETPVAETTTQPKKSKNKKNKANKACPIKDRAKAVNTNGKVTDEPIESDVSTSNENIPVEGNESQPDGDVKRVDEPTESAPIDDSVNVQTTGGNIDDIIDELVTEIQTKRSVESQNESDIPAQVLNGDNGVVPSTAPQSVQNEDTDSPTLATKLNNDESTPPAVNISSN